MDSILAWLNEPLNKTVLLFLGGLILKKWPAFVNKAIPMALLALSIVLTALKALFPGLVPDAQASVHAATAAAASAPWWKWLVVDVLVPVALAVGTHSAGKNTLELAKTR